MCGGKKKFLCALFPFVFCSQCREDASVDMLGICVCLCAVFTHALSQEGEEPISYRVSGTSGCCDRDTYQCGWFIGSLVPAQCTDGYEYDPVREQCRGG